LINVRWSSDPIGLFWAFLNGALFVGYIVAATSPVDGYAASLDPRALGLKVAAWLRVRPVPGGLNTVADILRTLPEIVECDRVTGEDCFVARAHVKSIEDLERLIDQIIPHAMTTTSIIQSTLVKRRSPPIVPNGDEGPNRVGDGNLVQRAHGSAKRPQRRAASSLR
jgi:hypothetical protein